jgi:indolepyruvate ferredoxin oxidoreductase beta subunit
LKEEGAVKKDGAAVTRSIVLAGVGGQGTIMAANLLARALLIHGFDVKTSEVHGMAQRGGSVVSMVRFGESVASPLVPRGEAEALVATEMLEALRYMHFLAPGGRVICSNTRIDPLPVLQGVEEYPGNADELILENAPGSVMVDAIEIAREAGSARAANTVLLGILSPSLPVTETDWLAALEEVVPDRVLEANRRAFFAGRALETRAAPGGGER